MFRVPLRDTALGVEVVLGLMELQRYLPLLSTQKPRGGKSPYCNVNLSSGQFNLIGAQIETSTYRRYDVQI